MLNGGGGLGGVGCLRAVIIVVVALKTFFSGLGLLLGPPRAAVLPHIRPPSPLPLRPPPPPPALLPTSHRPNTVMADILSFD